MSNELFFSHNVASGSPDPIHNREFRELVDNVLMTRSELFRRFLDPRRDVYDECGLIKIDQFLSAQDYQNLFDRMSTAARVVEVLPKETWQVQPTVSEDEDSETVTEFENAWDALGKQIRGEQSKYQDEEGSPVWEYLQLLDILSGIGRYGVLLFGLDDGQPLYTPILEVMQYADSRGSQVIEGVELASPSIEGTDLQYVPPQDLPDEYARPGTVQQPKKERKLLYLRAFPEALATITRWEANQSNPRFGLPVMYRITFNDPKSMNAGVGQPLNTVDVHWTRVLHVADRHNQAKASETFANPRIHSVLDHVLGLQKLYCGSPEMYWRGAFPGLALSTNPAAGGDVKVDKSGTRSQMEQYMNGLQRYLLLTNMTAETLSPQVVDPTPQIQVQLDAICIKLGIPKRVFMGSERGELASSQDDSSFNDRIRHRQTSYVTPRIIVPFVDRLIAYGILPEPVGYSVSWPDLDSQTQQQKATVALTQTQALGAYVSGGVNALVPEQDYLTRVIGWDEEEAEAVLERAAEQQEEKDQEAEAIAEEQGHVPSPPEGYQEAPPEEEPQEATPNG